MSAVCIYRSPLGPIRIESDGSAITGLRFTDTAEDAGGTDEIIGIGTKWLDSYFSGTAPCMLPPIDPPGTAFQKTVWHILMDIPYGTTVTYGDIASMLSDKGKRMSAQAVGGAVGSNPIAIMIPCHRVVGAGGKLTGYAAGLDRKKKLLDLERGSLVSGMTSVGSADHP